MDRMLRSSDKPIPLRLPADIRAALPGVPSYPEVSRPNPPPRLLHAPPLLPSPWSQARLPPRDRIARLLPRRLHRCAVGPRTRLHHRVAGRTDPRRAADGVDRTHRRVWVRGRVSAHANHGYGTVDACKACKVTAQPLS